MCLTERAPRTLLIIQARMGSTRLPGKVLVPIGDRPMLGFLLDSLRRCQEIGQVVVATSSEAGDDPIVDYCREYGALCHRGSHLNVASRFQSILSTHDCDAFVRLSADSPLLDHRLVDRAVRLAKTHACDVVTNIFPRTFPHGQSVELLRAETFLQAYEHFDSQADHEHVTPYFYRQPDTFHIHNMTNRPNFSRLQMAVDTATDLAVTRQVVERMTRPHWTYTMADRAALWLQQTLTRRRQAA